MVDINSIEDLNGIRNSPGATYDLLRNLDFQDDDSYDNPANKSSYTTGNGWVGINNFTGRINGHGFIISNLFTIDSTRAAFIRTGAAPLNINNIGFKDVYCRCTGATGRTAGVLAEAYGGSATSRITNVFVTGVIDGVRSSYGFAVSAPGQGNGRIENCYFQGIVKTARADSLACGFRIGGNSLNCYTTAEMVFNPSSQRYGFARDVEDSTSFWDSVVSGITSGGRGIPKTTAELFSISNYTGWDISTKQNFDPANPTTWFIDEGNDYPRLWFEYPKSSGTTVKYYNGTAWVDSLIKFHNGTEFIDAASIRSIT